MKIRDLIKHLQEFNQDAEIIDVGSFQDMNASVPYVSTGIRVIPLPGLRDGEWFMFKFEDCQIGATLATFRRKV